MCQFSHVGRPETFFVVWARLCFRVATVRPRLNGTAACKRSLAGQEASFAVLRTVRYLGSEVDDPLEMAGTASLSAGRSGESLCAAHGVATVCGIVETN